MPINFPNSPSIGATYDYEGIHYIYNGVGWVNKSIFGISAGTNISFTNYNGTGPIVISTTSSGGITSAVTSFNGLTGDVVGVSSFNGYTGGVTGWAYYNDGINSGLDTDLIQGISGQRFVENLQTGLLYGGLLQVNAGNSAYFDVSAGVGIISTAGASLTAYPTPSLSYITWSSFTGVTVTGITSDEETWISINSSGNLVQQNTKWLDSQFDNSIPLGVLIHPNNTTINFAVAIPHVAYGQPSQLDPFVRAFGPIKISGHEISANGANLQVNKSTGAAYLIGRNYATNPSSPNVVEDTNATPISTMYRYYRDGSGKFTVVTNSSIDPSKYDDGTGTLNTVPGGQYTIQRLFFLPGVPTVLASYYGRELYNSIETAQANIPFEQFTEDDSTASLGVFAGYLIVKSGATQLNNTADAKFINSGIFRNLSNIGGGGVAATSLDDLSDVTITSAANGQVLKYSSGVWVNDSVSNLNLVSAAVAGSGINVSGATGSVTITNTGVLSFNGNTGAVQGVSSINGSTGAITNVAFTNVAQTFSALQSFSVGVSAGYVDTDTIKSDLLTIDPFNLFPDSTGIRLYQDNGISQYYTTIKGAGPNASANQTITLPNDTGIVALTKNVVSSFNGNTGAVQGVSAAVAGSGISVSGATGSVTITNTGVLSFNGNTGAVQGVSAAVAGSGISVSGATGSVTITNTGVLSFNGNTGAVQGVSSINGNTGAITNVAFTNVNNNFSVTQNFAQGLTAANTVEFYADTSYFYSSIKGNRFLTVSPGAQNFISGNGASSIIINQSAGNAVYIGDADIANNGTYIRVEDNTSAIAFNYNTTSYTFPTTVGSPGQVLTTNGSNPATLSWSTATGSGGGVSSFNGLTGAVEGVSSLIGGTGISVSGATGTVTVTNQGVRTFNGATGDISYSGLSRYITSISTNTNAGSTAGTDFVYICTAGLTLTLPTAASNTNRYSVKNTSSSVVKVFTTSSQSIDGITLGYNLTRQYQAVDLVSDGSNWFVI
jgi:hypothetical protein